MTKPEKKCFVLMPFKAEMKEIYTDVYIPVCEKNALKCWRVDEISRPGSITKDIVEGILDADIVIADLTGRNANVFYELGIAHSAGNKTIMTAQSSEDVPFDIASYRVIFYNHNLTGCKELFKKLDTAIKELVVALDRTNNPLQEVLSSRGGNLRLGNKTPLVKAINVNYLGPGLKHYFLEKKVLYLEDLKKIDLEDLLSQKGKHLGKTSAELFCSLLLHFEFYENFADLQAFMIRHNLNVIDFQKNWRTKQILR